jgi:hypothetical protein
MKFYNPAVRLDLQPVGRNSKLDDVRVFTLVHQRISYSESGAYPDHSRVKRIPQRMGELLAGPSTKTKQADQNKHTRLSVVGRGQWLLAREKPDAQTHYENFT